MIAHQSTNILSTPEYVHINTMTSNNPVQCRVSKRVTFYDKHPLGPIAKGGYFRDDLARKGLKVDPAQLKLIKDYMLGCIKAKIESGEWDHNTTFAGLEGAKKRKPLIDAAKEKYGARFRWDRIPENHKDWVDRALAKLLVLLKSTYKQEARRLLYYRQQIASKSRLHESALKAQRVQSKHRYQRSLLSGYRLLLPQETVVLAKNRPKSLVNSLCRLKIRRFDSRIILISKHTNQLLQRKSRSRTV
jgi:hypothetical protein